MEKIISFQNDVLQFLFFDKIYEYNSALFKMLYRFRTWVIMALHNFHVTLFILLSPCSVSQSSRTFPFAPFAFKINMSCECQNFQAHFLHLCVPEKSQPFLSDSYCKHPFLFPFHTHKKHQFEVHVIYLQIFSLSKTKIKQVRWG